LSQSEASVRKGGAKRLRSEEKGESRGDFEKLKAVRHREERALRLRYRERAIGKNDRWNDVGKKGRETNKKGK